MSKPATAEAEARQALAAAIAALAAAEADVEATRAAIEAARDGGWDARQRLDELKAKPAPGPDAGAFVQAVRGGGNVAVLDMAPVDTTAAEIAEAEREGAAWAATRAACAAKLAETEYLRDQGRRRRDDAVRSVLAASGAVGALMRGLQELQDEVVSRRAQLLALLPYIGWDAHKALAVQSRNLMVHHRS